MSNSQQPPLSPNADTTIPLQFVINRAVLQEELTKSEKLPLGFIQLAIILKMQEFLAKKFPLTENELRRLFKLALYNYQKQNETPLEKLSALQSEERYEAFVKLKGYFQQEIEGILLKKDALVINYISSFFDGFFAQYIPGFST